MTSEKLSTRQREARRHLGTSALGRGTLRTRRWAWDSSHRGFAPSPHTLSNKHFESSSLLGSRKRTLPLRLLNKILPGNQPSGSGEQQGAHHGDVLVATEQLRTLDPGNLTDRRSSSSQEQPGRIPRGA